MGVRNWSEFQRRETKVICLGRYSDNSYGQASHDKLLQNGRWERFWRRWRLGNKGVSDSSYDPSDYFQNFDGGMGCTNSDNLSRSFSAQYTDASSRVRKEKLLIDL